MAKQQHDGGQNGVSPVASALRTLRGRDLVLGYVKEISKWNMNGKEGKSVLLTSGIKFSLPDNPSSDRLPKAGMFAAFSVFENKNGKFVVRSWRYVSTRLVDQVTGQVFEERIRDKDDWFVVGDKGFDFDVSQEVPVSEEGVDW